jgi:hypothetical protein
MVNYTNTPTSAAGGDLSGTYPNPSVAQSSAATFAVLHNLNVTGDVVSGNVKNFGNVIYQAGFNAGTNSAATAAILTAVAGTNGGAAVQLSDTARDYMVYLQVGTAGTAWVVSMGHTSAGNDVTLHASGTATAGQVLTFRLPAGWFFLWSATTATLAQSVAVSC